MLARAGCPASMAVRFVAWRLRQLCSEWVADGCDIATFRLQAELAAALAERDAFLGGTYCSIGDVSLRIGSSLALALMALLEGRLPRGADHNYNALRRDVALQSDGKCVGVPAAPPVPLPCSQKDRRLDARAGAQEAAAACASLGAEAKLAQVHEVAAQPLAWARLLAGRRFARRDGDFLQCVFVLQSKVGIDVLGDRPMAAGFEPDALVWVSCPEAVWRPGRVVAGPGLRVALPVPGGDEGEEEVIDVGAPQPAQGALASPRKPALRVLRRNAALVGDGALRFDDLTDVPELHEAAVLHALNVRFCKGVIFE
ncbi:unnamed protein product [Prorocentrum cordatum]|uniref:Uncharacterized protein n=1 Tax=Prorocentrum cordatum TaxID=2364126 RepID=A0ABN9V1P6_9DINO|nr:unnamed protein product [Polarella glacialis]